MTTWYVRAERPRPRPDQPRRRRLVVATAAVEEQQLLKTLRWYDGFVIALANPGFLLGSLGYSVADLGGWGAAMLWGISAFVAVFINTIYSELATMFPEKSGGLALYAHEAWRKYTTLVGPIATFGYWIGWSVVLSVLGLFIGSAHPGRLVPGRADREPVRRRLLLDRRLRGRAAAAHRHRAHPLRLAVQRLRRRRSAWLRLRRRRAPDDPAVRDDDPAVPERQLRQRQPHVHAERPGPRRGVGSSSRSSGSGSCAGRRGGWTSAPRSLPSTRTRPATRSWRSGRPPCSRWSSTSCSRSASSAAGAESSSSGYAYAGGDGQDRRARRRCPTSSSSACAQLHHHDEHGDRRRGPCALGISRDGMTIKQLGNLNRFNVPGNAMTRRHDRQHLLPALHRQHLRHPRGEQPRLRARAHVRALRVRAAAQGPAQLADDRSSSAAIWTPIAGLLAVWCLILTIVGFGWIQVAAGGYGGTKEKIIGVGVLADRDRCSSSSAASCRTSERPHWREDTPTMPEGTPASLGSVA